MGSQAGAVCSGDDCDLLPIFLSVDHGSDLHRQRVHRARHVRRLDLRANAELPMRALPDRGAGDGVRIHLSSGGGLVAPVLTYLAVQMNFGFAMPMMISTILFLVLVVISVLLGPETKEIGRAS